MEILRRLFGGRQRRLDELATELIANHLREWGIEIQSGGSVLAAGSIPYALQCNVLTLGSVHGTHKVQLDVLTWIDYEEQTVIGESHAGVGPRYADAVSNAVHKWLRGVYPVLAVGLGENEPAPAEAELPQVDREQLHIEDEASGDKVPWNVFVGPVILGTDHEVEVAPHLRPFDHLRDTLTNLKSRGNLVWGRMFVGGVGADLTYECLLNNESWDDGVAALRRMDFPKTVDYLSVRQFYVARLAE